jgi:multisubunit Na+/H+ antiporter MnhG subunit
MHEVAVAMCCAGVGVAVLSTVGASLAGRDRYLRLHYLTPVTSVAAPLIGVGLSLENGWSLTTGEILLIVGLLALSGPIAAAATGRLFAQSDGTAKSESPE